MLCAMYVSPLWIWSMFKYYLNAQDCKEAFLKITEQWGNIEQMDLPQCFIYNTCLYFFSSFHCAGMIACIKFHNDSLLQLLKPHKWQSQLYIHVLEDKATQFWHLSRASLKRQASSGYNMNPDEKRHKVNATHRHTHTQRSYEQGTHKKQPTSLAWYYYAKLIPSSKKFSLGWGYFASSVLNLKNAQLTLNKAPVIRFRKPTADFTTFKVVHFLFFLPIPSTEMVSHPSIQQVQLT